LVGPLGRRVEGEGLVKAGSGFGFGLNIFRVLLLLKKCSRLILMFDEEELMLEKIEDDVCFVDKDDLMIVMRKSELKYDVKRKSGNALVDWLALA